jgi:hypothetical protein
MPAFSSTLTLSSLVWLTSLAPNERGSTRRIQEDLIPYLDRIGLHYIIGEPQTQAQLYGMLSQIAMRAVEGMRPILHFDMHGDAKHGIRLNGSGEFISWPDLVDRLRIINMATGNNLCVVSSACSSMESVYQVALSRPCPFFILIAPEREVSAGYLEDRIFPFYRTLFEDQQVLEAHARHLAPGVALHYCERMLAFLLAKYVRQYCIGKGGDERREQLLTKARAAGLCRNRSDMRRIRRAAKEWTRPSQAMVERFANGLASTFLMGRPLSFDIDDVVKLIEAV